MKKRRLSIFFIAFFIASNIFNVNVQAEVEVYSESISGEYLLEHYSNQEMQAVDLNSQFDAAGEKIRQGLVDLDDTIYLEQFNIPTDLMGDLFFGLIADHPEIFYTNGFSWMTSQNRVISLSPNYRQSKDEIRRRVDEVNSKVDQVLDEIIEPSMTEFEKEFAIHNYIVLNTAYDSKNYHNGTIPQDSYTVYGVLINQTAVCQGYAETMKLLLNRVGIEAIILSSAEMNHAWNIVTIDGENYHVDATWDDPVPNREGYVRYKYLNVSDKKMRETHSWDYDSYPKAKSDKYSFLRDQNSRTSQYLGSDFYYLVSDSGYINGQLHQVSLKTLEARPIPNVYTSSFALAGDWIYFSNEASGNFSNYGCIYKVRTDGSQLTRLTDHFGYKLEIRDGYLYYEGSDQIEYRIKIDLPTEPEIPEEDNRPTIEESYLDRFTKWVESFFIAPLDVWKVKFNLPLNKSSINNNNVYVIDENRRILNDLKIRASDDKTIILTPEKEYPAGHYYLIIENFESADGKILSKNVKVEFTVE